MSKRESPAAVTDRIWLTFFNNLLLEKGLISESEHSSLQAIILESRPNSAAQRPSR